MFDIGLGELIIILTTALLVLGPAQIPPTARALGRAVRQIRALTQSAHITLLDADRPHDRP